MGVFKRGSIWWYQFRFAGQRVRESSKSRSKSVAERAERKRRHELEEGFHSLTKRVPPRPFSVASDEYLKLKQATLAPRSLIIERTNLAHINPVLGRLLVSDIKAEDISRYQQHRLSENASPKTVNLEVGTIRSILRRNKLWHNIQQDVRMLPTRDDAGKAISREEEAALLAQCLKSRSRSLYPAVVLALNTAMRYSEIRLLRWSQVNLAEKYLTVGQSKTNYGTGRVIPLNGAALTSLQMWAAQFADRKPEHYVFPSERYGASGDEFTACTYDCDTSRPIGSFKTAWETAKATAGVTVRFHDLRHTACTRMLEHGIPFSVVASVMGWSPSTTVRMAKRYGHIGQVAQRQAVETICLGEQEDMAKAESQSRTN